LLERHISDWEGVGGGRVGGVGGGVGVGRSDIKETDKGPFVSAALVPPGAVKNMQPNFWLHAFCSAYNWVEQLDWRRAQRG
jgi:hypothetical protein